MIWINQNLPRGMFGAEQISDMFGAEQTPDMFLVRNKYRTFFGAEQIPDIIYLIKTVTCQILIG